jgi:hypothetical protein
MRRITRNERVRDIKPERERGPVVFKLPLRGDAEHDTGKHIPRGDAEHDPMFPRPTGGVGVAVWIGGLDPLPASPTPATPEPVQELQQYYEQLPPPPPEQHNDHVMTYWMWRLDRMEAKRNG